MFNTKIKIAVCQFNSFMGDIGLNIDRLLLKINEAKNCGADLFVMPELAVCGYPPEDLLLRNEFHQQIMHQIERFLSLTGITIMVSCPILESDVDSNDPENNYSKYSQLNSKLYNSVLIIKDGAILGRYDKRSLPNYGVFDEKRYFTAGDGNNNFFMFQCNAVNIGILICEDMWVDEQVAELAKLPVDMICVVNASPFEINKHQQRLSIARNHVTKFNLPLLYVNSVGGQDELVFDGASFALNLLDNELSVNKDNENSLVMQLPAFIETQAYIDFDKKLTKFISSNKSNSNISEIQFKYPSIEARVYDALVLAVRDYVTKNKFKGVLIGLSGGVDSALTLAIAVDALGSNNVMCVMMPSIFTADISSIDAKDMLNRLKVRSEEISIMPVYESFNTQLAGSFLGLPADLTEENLQARIRGTLLMALSNKFGYLVLTTGNKSEMAMGYTTLYGDMAGGFAVLKDVPKTLVYKLCRLRNSISDIIPERIITRAPSAELRANQTDQDSLPPYEILDQIIYYLVEEKLSSKDILAFGFDSADVERVANLLRINEYKRRQSPIGPKISSVAFAKDWRYPVTNGFKF